MQLLTIPIMKEQDGIKEGYKENKKQNFYKHYMFMFFLQEQL